MRLFTLFGSSLIALLLTFGGAAWQVSTESVRSDVLQDDTLQDDTIRSERIARGAELYSRMCQRCHSTRGPEEYTDRKWVIIMQHMQTRGNLTRNQVELVRDFILSSNEAAMAPGQERASVQEEQDAFTPADVTEELVTQGQEIYTGAGGCTSCHGADLEGGPIAPSLVDDRWKNGDGSLESILETIRNGVSGTAMAPYPGGISDDQARAAAAYVWEVSQGQRQP